MSRPIRLKQAHRMKFDESKVYSLSELASVLKESASESKPKIDSKVIRDNAQNNTKAVGDIMKETSKLDSKAKKEERDDNPQDRGDLNRTTLDNHFAYEPDDTYKERVKAQVHGFPSAENEKTTDAKDNKSLDFEGNKKFYDDDRKKMKDFDGKETDIKHSGLASREMPKDTYKSKLGFTESKKMKRLQFSHTTFLSEEQMLRKIPAEYKTDGNKFVMADAAGNQYLIECIKDKSVDYVYTNVKVYQNKQKLAEQHDRMLQLMGYRSSDYNPRSTKTDRINEDRKLGELITSMKKLEEGVAK